MNNRDAIAATLRQRLVELDGRVKRTEQDLRQPLAADFEEQAVDLEDHDTLEALEAAGRKELHQITQALDRLADGTYGTCSLCGVEIAPKRLEVQPTATECIDCAA